MAQGIEVVYTIIQRLINLLFNEIYILNGVSLGWIVTTILIFSILFNSILNIPQGLISSAIEKNERKNSKRFGGGE